MKTYISKDQCPFMAGDRVRCDYTHVESTVHSIEDDVVWCITDTGTKFYRTWWHDLDMVMRKSGGGLTRIDALPFARIIQPALSAADQASRVVAKEHQ